MKKICMLLYVLFPLAAFSQIGIGTTNPNATVDIRSSNQITPANTDGLLIPKVNAFPAANPTANQQGMMVYLTTASGLNNPGFYYWDFPTLSWVGLVSTVSSTNNVEVNSANFEDFLFDAYGGNGSNDNQYAFTTSGNGDIDGSAANYAAYGAGNDYAGIHRLSTGNSSTGKGSLASFNFVDRMKVGSLGITYEIRVRFSALSTATQTFTSLFGLCNLASGASASSITNGIYFQYTTAGLVGRCRNTAFSTTATPVVPIAANSWYKLKAVINAAGNNVDFYLNNTLMGSVATNIPAGAMKFVFHLEKSVGTTTITNDIDYIAWKMMR